MSTPTSSGLTKDDENSLSLREGVMVGLFSNETHALLR